MLKAPSVALWLARALNAQGRLVAAAERYAEAARLPTDQGDATVQAAAQRDAAEELDALTPQIPNLMVQVPGAAQSELALAIDGQALPSAVVGEQQPVDPGKHHIEVRRGDQLSVADVELARGETKTATLRFTESGSAPTAAANDTPGQSTESVEPEGAAARAGKSMPSQRALGFVVGGAGVAGLAVGGVFGYLALQSRQEQLDQCASPSDCPDHSGAATAHDAAVTRGTISTVAFIAGAAATTLGIVLIATAKTGAHEEPRGSVSLLTNDPPRDLDARSGVAKHSLRPVRVPMAVQAPASSRYQGVSHDAEAETAQLQLTTLVCTRPARVIRARPPPVVRNSGHSGSSAGIGRGLP